MFNKFTHLWNDLPYDERERLMPYMIEQHLFHLWQCRAKAARHHEAHIKSIDDHMDSLKQGLAKYEK